MTSKQVVMPKVAILGAGAIGMPLGYMLARKGRNEVTYLIREKRVAEYETKGVKIFDYDSKKLIEHGNIKCLATEPLSETVGDESGPYSYFDVVIITLPTDLLESESGRQMIKGLADRGKPECVYLLLSPGFRMQEKVFGPCGIPKKQVCYGLPLFLSHEVGMKGQPVHAKYAARDEADLAIHYLVSKGRIVLLSKKPRAISKVLSKAGSGSITAGERTLEASTVMFLVMNLILYLQDYPKSLKKRDPSFRVGIAAFSQIMHQYGGLGRMFRIFVGKNMLKLVEKGNRWSSKPLTTDFLRHHHGHKVKDQNVQVIKMYIDTGKAKNRRVDKIEEFVQMCETSSPEATHNAEEADTA